MAESLATSGPYKEPLANMQRMGQLQFIVQFNSISDSMKLNRRRFDVRTASALLERIGIGSKERIMYSPDLIFQHGSSSHGVFLDAYYRIAWNICCHSKRS